MTTPEFVIVNGEALELMDDGRFPVYYHFPENTRLFDATCCPPRLVPLEEEGDEKGVTLFRLIPHAPYFAFSVAGPEDQVLARRIIAVPHPNTCPSSSVPLNINIGGVGIGPQGSATKQQGVSAAEEPTAAAAGIDRVAAIEEKIKNVAPRSTTDDIYSAIPQSSSVFPANRCEFIGQKIDSLVRCATSGRPPVQNEDGSYTFVNMLDRRNRTDVSNFKGRMEQTDPRGLHRYIIVHGLPPSTTAEDVGKYFESHMQFVFDSDVCSFEDSAGRKLCRSTAFAELRDLDETFRFLLNRYLPYNDGHMYVVGADRKPNTEVPRLEPFPTVAGPAPHREHIEPPRAQQRGGLNNPSHNRGHEHVPHHANAGLMNAPLSAANGAAPFGDRHHQHQYPPRNAGADPSSGAGGGRFYNGNNNNNSHNASNNTNNNNVGSSMYREGGRYDADRDRPRRGEGGIGGNNAQSAAANTGDYAAHHRGGGTSFGGPSGFGRGAGPRAANPSPLSAGGGGAPPIRDTRESRTSEPLHVHLASNSSSSTSTNPIQTPTSLNSASNLPLPRQLYNSLQSGKGSPTNSTPNSFNATNSSTARGGGSVIYCVGHISEHVTESSVQDKIFMPSKRAYDKLLQLCSSYSNVYLIVVYDRHPMVFGIAKITGRAGVDQLSCEWIAPHRNLSPREIPHKLLNGLGLGEMDARSWADGLRVAEGGDGKLNEGPLDACIRLHEFLESCPARPETGPSTPTSPHNSAPHHYHGGHHHHHNHHGGHGPYGGGRGGGGHYGAGYHHSNSFAANRQGYRGRGSSGAGPHSIPTHPVAL